jgi:hypothetical protein
VKIRRQRKSLGIYENLQKVKVLAGEVQELETTGNSFSVTHSKINDTNFDILDTAATLLDKVFSSLAIKKIVSNTATCVEGCRGLSALSNQFCNLRSIFYGQTGKNVLTTCACSCLIQQCSNFIQNAEIYVIYLTSEAPKFPLADLRTPATDQFETSLDHWNIPNSNMDLEANTTCLYSESRIPDEIGPFHTREDPLDGAGIGRRYWNSQHCLRANKLRLANLME